MDDFTYKIENLEAGKPEYAIRYNDEEVYAKMKGDEEFLTSFDDNDTAYEVSLDGIRISKEEYENF